MTGKGGELHRFLKVKAIERLVQSYNIDQISEIKIETKTYESDHDYRHGNVAIDLSILDAKKTIFPDIQCILRDLEDKGKRRYERLTDKLIAIECEVAPNSNLLSDGIRKTAYKLLKEQHKDRFILIVAKFKGVPISDRELFDEIWEFEKPSGVVKDG